MIKCVYITLRGMVVGWEKRKIHIGCFCLSRQKGILVDYIYRKKALLPFKVDEQYLNIVRQLLFKLHQLTLKPSFSASSTKSFP